MTQPPSPRPGLARWLPALAAASFVVLWSTGYPAGKIAVSHGGAFTTLVIRFGIAALIFGALAVLGGARLPNRREALHSVVVGLLQLALQFGGVYGGLKLGASAGIAALVIGAMPLTVSLMALALGEHIRPRQWLGLAVGLAGVLLVIGERLFAASAGAFAMFALLLGLVGISAGTLYQKAFGATLDLRAGLFIQNLTATLALLPLALIVEDFRYDDSTAFWTATAWLVIVNSIGGFGLLFVLIRSGAATQVAALFYLVPAVGAVMGHFALGEVLTPLEIAGFLVAAVGVYLGTHSGIEKASGPPDVA